MANAYVAGAANAPFALFRGSTASDLPRYNDLIKPVSCPFTDEVLIAVPSLRPDVTVIHAHRVDSLRRMTNQTLVIVGEYDPSTPPAHLSHIEAAPAFNDALLGFLRNL